MLHEGLQVAGAILVYGLIGLLCAAGLLLSALSFSGTWFVVAAAAVAALYRADPFPGWLTLIGFTLVSAGLEGVEYFASLWGVTRRGGSKTAGFAAMLGGIAGTILGALLPLPLLGSLLGMVAGSFAMAFLVEWQREKRRDHAAHVAWGVVIGRVAVILLKVAATLGMTVFLAVGMLL